MKWNRVQRTLKQRDAIISKVQSLAGKNQSICNLSNEADELQIKHYEHSG